MKNTIPSSIPTESLDNYKYTDNYRTYKCDYCKENFKRFSGEYNYTAKIDNKIYLYCSYTCRSKALKQHENERELLKTKLNNAETLKEKLQYCIKLQYNYEQIGYVLNLYPDQITDLMRKYKLNPSHKKEKKHEQN